IMKKIIAIISLFFFQSVQGMDFIKAALSKLYTQPKAQACHIPKECEHLISFKQKIEKITKENITEEDIQTIAENFPRCSNIAKIKINSGEKNGLRATTVLTFGNTISHTRTTGVLVFNKAEIKEQKVALYINLISIKKECQKQGIGTKLLNFLETDPHLSYICLHSTFEAMPFYKKNGFTLINNNGFLKKNIKNN
ncbi:GNAT family N-acetyltransferase, partial [Candidatus Babeliales bacterium]|nr:GNAT family N-acetyltransferase [Candidatus Babeliales bacterium]